MIAVNLPGTSALTPLERHADATRQRRHSSPFVTTRAVKQSATMPARSASLAASLPVTFAAQVVYARTLADGANTGSLEAAMTPPLMRASSPPHNSVDGLKTFPSGAIALPDARQPEASEQANVSDNALVRISKNIGKTTLQVGVTVGACKLMQQGIQEGVSLLLKNNVFSAAGLGAAAVTAPFIANVIQIATDCQQDTATKTGAIASYINALLPVAACAGLSVVSGPALAAAAPTLVSATLYSVFREMASVVFALADNNRGPDSGRATTFSAVAYGLNQSAVSLAQESIAAQVNDAIGLMMANTVINTAGEVVDTLVNKNAQALAQHNDALTVSAALQPRELANVGKITEILFQKAPKRLSFIETIVLGSTFIHLVLKNTLPPAQAKAAEYTLNGALIALAYVPFVFAGQQKAPLSNVELEAVVIDALQSAADNASERQTLHADGVPSGGEDIALQEVIVHRVSPVPERPAPRDTVVDIDSDADDSATRIKETKL